MTSRASRARSEIPRCRFIHTADWQLGMTRHFLDSDAQPRYTAARIDAITTIGALAVEVEADFIVVAGDVLDDNAISRTVLRRSLEALRTLKVPVILLPGNHDPLDSASAWTSTDFERFAPPNVSVVRDSQPVEPIPGVEVLGVPWTSKRPDPSRIRGVLSDLKESDSLRILLAHGDTDGQGPNLDSSVPALRMNDVGSAIAQSHLHYVALGDCHSTVSVGETERCWYSGSPEPTDFDDIEKDSGNVLVVDLERTAHGALCTVEKRQVARWQMLTKAVQIDTDEDVRAFAAELEKIDNKSTTVLRLKLSGTVSVRVKAKLDDLLDDARDTLGALTVWERHYDLHVVPEDADFTTAVSGFAKDAVARLSLSVDSGGPQASTAADALTLLYRLSGGGPR